MAWMRDQQKKAAASGDTFEVQGNVSDYVDDYLATLTQAQVAKYQAQASVGVLQGDSRDADSFAAVLEKLRKLGLTGGAYKELALSGDLSRAQAYVSSPELIKQLVQEFKDRRQSVQQLAQSSVPPEMTRAITRQAKATERQADETHELREGVREMNRLQKLVEQRLQRIENNSPKKTGDAVAGALNNTVTHSQNKAVK